jgi:DNA-binding MarR family transcriptional regulator
VARVLAPKCYDRRRIMTDRHEARQAAEAMVAALKRFQDSVDLFDATAAASLGINATDLRCLTALRDRGAMKASEVAVGLGLTRGATTTALDRLQARDFLTRRAHAEDGRSVVVELTDEGRGRLDAIWGPMRRRGGEHLRSYSVSELQLLERFFNRSVELQTYCTQNMRAPGERASSRLVTSRRR